MNRPIISEKRVTSTGSYIRMPYGLCCATPVETYEQACNAIPFHIVTEPAARLSTGLAIPGTQNLYRSDNGFCLGQHTPQYSFTQPCESLEILEKARDLMGGKWQGVSVFKGGRKIMASVTLDTQIKAPNRGDTVAFGLFHTDIFDGTGFETLSLGSVNLTCTNGNTSLKSICSFSGKHNQTLAEKIKQMSKSIMANIALEIGRTREIVFTLDMKEMSNQEMTEFAERLFPSPEGETVSTRTENIRQAIVTGFSRGTGNHGETRWDAFNAVTEYLDWQSTFRETEFSREENRLDSLLNGNGAKIRNRAMELLLAQ